jgi:D-alanine-D-alanine ligase
MKNVTLIFGGKSAEHHVSIRSGLAVVKNIDYTKYSVDVLYFSLSGKYYYSQNINSLDKAKIFVNKYQQSADLVDSHKAITFGQTVSFLQKTDVVFSLLHGKRGEDGVMQGMLESLEVAYVGSGVSSSAITMDKTCTKRILQSQEINVTPFLSFSKFDFKFQEQDIVDEIQDNLPFPLFVKPSNFGSSIGVEKVSDAKELEKALIEAFSVDDQVLVEKAIVGKEIEVAILENIDPMQPPIVSPAGEIKVVDAFYTYEAKYIKKDAASFSIPADLNAEQNKELKILTEKIFRLCGCSGLARVDYFIEENTGKIYFNEINTIPGFTDISLYPRLLKEKGWAFSQIIEQLVSIALREETHSKEKAAKEIEFLSKYAN